MKFIHRLPAFHACDTKIGAEIATRCRNLANGIKVTEDLLGSACTRVAAFAECEAGAEF